MTQPHTSEHGAVRATEPIGTVLARIRAELEDIAQRIDANQALIARTGWQRGIADSDYMRAMQDADLSAQRVSGLATYLRAISDAACPQWRVDTSAALAGITLATMAKSLGGDEQTGRSQDEGDVDLF